MCNRKKLGPFSSGLGQHGNKDDLFLRYYRTLHVFCGNTVGFDSLYDLGGLEDFGSLAWLCTYGFRRACDDFDHGLWLLSSTGV